MTTRRDRDPDAQRERADRALPRDARTASGAASSSTSSSSTAARPTRRVEIARDRTAHGSSSSRRPSSTTRRSLNVGIEEVRGDLVVSLSAHAIPVDERLARATDRAVRATRAWPASSSRQVPWPDAPWQEVQRLQRPVRRRPPRICSRATRRRARCSATPRRRSGGASGSEQPFTLPAVEDLDWARRVVAAGWTIVYEPAAVVYHSHHESPRAQARRLIDISRVTTPAARRTRLRTACARPPGSSTATRGPILAARRAAAAQDWPTSRELVAACLVLRASTSRAAGTHRRATAAGLRARGLRVRRR